MFNKKRILSLALAVMLIAAAMITPHFMFAFESEGICGEEVSWSYNSETSTLTISGKGEMTAYENEEDIPWKLNFSSDIETVIVEDTVTSLSSSSFSDMPNLKRITLGLGIQNIPERICMNDVLLSEIIIKGEILRIGDLAFNGCSKITSFDIPKTVTDIGRSILTGSAVNKLIIEANLNSAGNSFGGAFDIANLTEVTFGEEVKTIPAYAFYNAIGLKKLIFKGSMETIGECAFSGCSSLMNFDLGSDIKKIGRNAFSDSGITEIVIHSDLENAGDDYGSAFANSNIKKITFSEKVNAIPDNALTYASNVEQVYFLNKNCIIPDSEKTISENTVIYGCYVSTANDYASKYNRKIVFICPTGDHKFTKEVVEPNCTEQGYVVHTCTECGISYKTDYVDPLGHKSKWVVSVNATYTKPGKMLLICEVCGEEQGYRTIPMLEKPTSGNPTTGRNQNTSLSSRTTIIHRVPTAPTAIQPLQDIDYSDFKVVPGEAGLKVSWKNDKRVNGYNIYLSTDKKTFKKIASTKDNKLNYYIIKDLGYNKVYYVKIAGYVGKNTECKEALPVIVKTK